jgi:hypothetical protein
VCDHACEQVCSKIPRDQREKQTSDSSENALCSVLWRWKILAKPPNWAREKRGSQGLVFKQEKNRLFVNMNKTHEYAERKHKGESPPIIRQKGFFYDPAL